jgi:TolB-like protein
VSDIFISYARSTEAEARAVGDALRARGYSVWRDDDLPSHRAYADVIAEQLASAKAVVVIWSADAVKSQWVRSEADRARSENKLVQLSFDGAQLPMPFDQIQCASLSGWAGDASHADWRRIVASIEALIAASSPTRGESPIPADREPLLAVLAFDSLSADADMTFFSDGVSDEILETVSRTSAVKVIGRASSFQFRGAQKAARHVASELKVSHILDGSVRKSGSRVRISAQLVECAHETTLWSERFDRDLSDVFALQDEIAEAVAKALRVAFAPSPQVGPIQAAAYELFLRAKGLAITPGDTPAMMQRLLLLEKVTRLAPSFAPGWAFLAHIRAFITRLVDSDRPYEMLRSETIEAAETALRLDPASGPAQSALFILCPYAQYFERDRRVAAAVEAAPDDESTRFCLTIQLSETGRMREAEKVAREAYALNPLDPNTANMHAYIRAYNGDDNAAVQALYDAYRDRWPDHAVMTVSAANFAALAGDQAKTEAMCSLAEQYGFMRFPVLARIFAFARGLVHGDPAYRDFIVNDLHRGIAETGRVSLDAIFAAGAVGCLNEAFAAVEQASFAHMFRADARSSLVANGWTTAFLFNKVGNASMIADPRFVGLCAKIGLCDYWVETGNWPDCADTVAYDFRAEAHRLVGAGRSVPAETH